MDSGKLASLLVVVVLTILGVIGSISTKPMDQQWSNNPQPVLPHYELHPIDNCIFACDHCFKDDALVRCANACILSEASLGPEWTATCPYLARQYTHPLGNAGAPFLPINSYRH